METEDKDMEQRISLAAVAKETGVPLRTVQYHAKKGYLKTESLSPHVRWTTRRWAWEWLEGEYKRNKAKLLKSR